MLKKTKTLIRSRDDRIVDAVVWCISLLVLLAVLYPLVYILSSSFSEPNEVALGNVTLLPKGFTLEGYAYILDYDDIWIGYRNTIFYTLAGTLLNLACTLPAAYALAQGHVWQRIFYRAFRGDDVFQRRAHPHLPGL